MKLMSDIPNAEVSLQELDSDYVLERNVNQYLFDTATEKLKEIEESWNR